MSRQPTGSLGYDRWVVEPGAGVGGARLTQCRGIEGKGAVSSDPRVLDVAATEVAEFLSTCRPLHELTADQLAETARKATVEQYASGAVILDAFQATPDELFALWRGRVGLWGNAERLTEMPDETVARGALFGYTAALVGDAVGPRAVAAGEVVVVRIGAELVADAFASAAGAHYLASEVRDLTHRQPGVPTYTLVDDLLVRPPLVIDPGTSIRAAAGEMYAADLSYAGVRLPEGGHGLITDATLRRVLGSGGSTDRPVSDVMTRDPATVRCGTSGAETLITMLERDAEYVLVTDNADQLRGVVEPRDFVVSSMTTSASLHEQIRRAETVEDVGSRYRLVPQMLADLSVRGLAPHRIITVHSAIVDTAVRRVIALVLARHQGLTVDAFTWLSLGSNGRREAVFSSDIDAAVAFHNDADAEEIGRYLPVFAEIMQILHDAGLSSDTHGVSPANRPFARTHREWQRAARQWLSSPTKGQAIIMTCLMVDGRPIHGDPGLPEASRVFSGLRRHPLTMKLMLRAALDPGAFGRRHWLRRRRDFDLKTQAMLPIVNIARWAALSIGSTALSTTERLFDAAGSELLSSADAATLIEVFEVLEDLRLRHQLEQVETGEKPTDTVQLRELNSIDRDILSTAVKEIAAVRRRLNNLAEYHGFEDGL